MKAKIFSLTLLLFIVCKSSFAQNYYTIGNATWNANGNWSNTDGGPDCTCNPAGVAGANVTINPGHTATVTDSTHIAVNNTITVEGTLTLNNGNSNPIATLTTAAGSTINILAGNFKLASPATTTINGTINRQTIGTFPNGLTFSNTSIYDHARDGGTIPTATWQAGSICRITGVNATMPTGWAGQTFGDLVWDCINQNIYAAFDADFTIAGNFEVVNTRAGAIPLGAIPLGLAVASSGNHTITCGSFTINKPNPNEAVFYPYAGGAYGTGTLEVLGNVTIINGGTGVLSGIGRSIFKMIGSTNSTFNYNASFSFYNNAEFEIQVAKTGTAEVTFTSPINFLSFDPASGTPASILNIVSGTANIANNTIISVGTIEGTGTLLMQNNASLYLKRHNTAFNNTFSGTLNAFANSTIFYDSGSSNNPMTIFAPSASSYYHNIRLLGGTGVKTLAGNIVLRGNWENDSGATNFNSATHSVSFEGTNLQSIAGGNPTTFYSLIINNASNISLSQNIAVTDALTLTNGRLILNNNNLTYSGTVANLTRTNGWVETNGTGTFIKNIGVGSFTFPVGSASHYQPITLDSAALGASVRFGTPTAPVPNSGVGSWFVNNLYVVSDIEIENPQGGTLTWGTSQIGIYNTSWTSQSGTTYPSTNIYRLNSVNFSSPIEFSVFTPSVITDYYTLANGAIWNVNSNLWSNDGTTPCNCSPNGVANANVRIRHNASIPASASVDAGTIINIENPVTLVTDQAFTAASLAGVSGARLAVTFNGLPAITTNSFATTAGTIVEFAGGAGSIPANFSGNPYRNLEISNPGTKTLSAVTTVSETLAINNSTLDISTHNLSVSGTTTLNNASILDTGAGGTNKFTGVITIGAGSSFLANPSANGSIFLFENDITNNGTFDINCDCQYNFNKTTPPLTIVPNQAMVFGFLGNGGNANFLSNTTIANGQNVTFNSRIQIGSVIVTNNNTNVQINDTLNGVAVNSTWLQGANAVLSYAANQSPMSTGVFDAATNPNTVIYNRTGNQDIKTTTYRNLVISSNSNSFLIGDITVNGNLTINTASTLNAVNHNINLRGNWVGNGTFNAGTGNVIFDGTALQTITTNSSAFNNITINNLAHVQLNNSVQSASITFTQGRLQVGNFDLLLTANPAANQITQTFTNASTSYVETNGIGGLVRNNLQIGIEYVFPVGSATSIRHLSINPNGGTSAKAIFGTLSPPAPTGSTDIAAGRWLLSGGNGILTFFNTGCNTNNARVYRLNAGVWDATGITTTASTPIYTTNSQNFSTGEIYTLFAPVNLTVLPSSPTLPSTEVGNNYSFTFSATGGTAPYTFSVSAGTLPTGLSLNPSTGDLSGIPTQAGTFSFTITATDISSNTGSQGYTLLVNKASQTIVASSLTYVALGNNRFDVSVTTSKGLPAKLFSTNNNVAQIEKDTILVIRQNFGEADIMAFHPGDANYNPSDTVRVMRIVNFEFVTAVNANLESKIKLFPNPTNGKIWIDIANFGVEKLEIYNTLGQKQNIVWSNTNNHIEIVTDTLSRGVYVLHLHTKQGSVTKRFSKL
jgi:hypothetical protein